MTARGVHGAQLLAKVGMTRNRFLQDWHYNPLDRSVFLRQRQLRNRFHFLMIVAIRLASA